VKQRETVLSNVIDRVLNVTSQGVHEWVLLQLNTSRGRPCFGRKLPISASSGAMETGEYLGEYGTSEALAGEG
jgi:hypothetical protein